MSENLQQPGKRKGNPKWVPGGPSPNPGGRTADTVQLNRQIAAIHAGPLALEALDRLRSIGMGALLFPAGKATRPAEDKVQVQALVAYLDRVGARVPVPKEGEDDKSLKDLTAEEMDELAKDLAAKAAAKRSEVS